MEEENYKKLYLLQKTKLPNEILELIKKIFKLELIHEKAKNNKKNLTLDLKNIKRSDCYKTTINNYSFRMLNNGIRELKKFNIPINHWLIHYEKDEKIHWNQCARQMIHCRKCGEYINVSTTPEEYWLIDNIKCNCNPFPLTFFDSKYFIPEMWFSTRYLNDLRISNFLN